MNNVLNASKNAAGIFSVLGDKKPFTPGVPIFSREGLAEHKFWGWCAQFFVHGARKDANKNALPTPMSELIGEKHLPYASGKIRNTGKALIEKLVIDSVPCLSIPVSIDMFRVDMGKRPEGADTATLAALKEAGGKCIGSVQRDPVTDEVKLGYDGKPLRKTLFVRILITAENARAFPVGNGDLIHLYNVKEVTRKGYEHFVLVEGMTRTPSKFAGTQTQAPKGKEITRKPRKAKAQKQEQGLTVPAVLETVAGVTL